MIMNPGSLCDPLGAFDIANFDKEFKTREFIALQFDLINE